MKVVIKIVYICLSLMLILPVISAITEEEIKERLKGLDEIEDFEISFIEHPLKSTVSPKNMTIIIKLPNFYKETVFVGEDLYSQSICYKDLWGANYYEDMIYVTHYDGVLDFFKRLFGMGPCKKQVQNKLLYWTPEHLLGSDYQKEFYIKFEEGIFGERNTIKAIVASHKSEEFPQGSYPLRYSEIYYDNETLFKIAQIFYCNPQNPFGPCIKPDGAIEYTSIVVNKGIQESEFELFVPEGAKICENDYDKSLTLISKFEETEKKAWNERRKLTEEEYYYVTDLKIEVSELWCREPDTRTQCTYSQYLGEVFPECVDLTTDLECYNILLEAGKVVESSPGLFEPALGYEVEWVCYKRPEWYPGVIGPKNG